MDITTRETELTVRRTFDAPIDRVFRAFTDPADLTNWYMPDGTAEVDAFEAREGGDISITMPTTEGDFTMEGTITEIETNERLVHTWEWTTFPDSTESLVTVTFEEVEDGTEVVLTHERLQGEKDVENHKDGWIENLDNLAEIL